MGWKKKQPHDCKVIFHIRFSWLGGQHPDVWDYSSHHAQPDFHGEFTTPPSLLPLSSSESLSLTL